MRTAVLPMALVCAVLAVHCAKTPRPVRASIDFFAGEVRVVCRGEERPARAGMDLPQGCRVTTGEKSFTRIALDRGTVALYENTMVELSLLAYTPGKSSETIVLGVDRGAVLSRVTPCLIRGGGFSISSRTMSAGVRGTCFLFGVEGERGVIACFLGKVLAARHGGEGVLLGPGQMLFFGPGRDMKARPVPPGFRYRDFEHGKEPYPRTGLLGSGKEVEGVPAPGGGGRNGGSTASNELGVKKALSKEGPRPEGFFPKPEVGLPEAK